MRSGNLIATAEAHAKRSSHEFKHGAVLAKEGKIIGVGKNRYCSSTPRSVKRRGRLSIHAEEAAMKQAGHCTNAIMYVVRLNSSGLAFSKPCGRCEALMRISRIEKVTYSTHDGGVESMLL
jgi:tRNA(Arg) A34 adenosine deaminase TadA